MKHIFIVHSPITYLSALGVVLKENLKKDDVLIISETFSLGYEPIPIVKLSGSLKTTRFSTIFGSSVQRKLYKYLDQEIKGELFTAYIPVFHYLDRFLILHKNCIGFHFIEEGLAAYYTSYSLNQYMIIPKGDALYSDKFTKRLKQIFWEVVFAIKGYTGKLNSIPTFYLAYAYDEGINFYGFHSLAHKFAVNRKIISFEDILVNYGFKSILKLNNCYIWVNDPDIEALGKYTVVEFLDVIRRGYINFLKINNIEFTYLRFHYRDDFKQRKMILDMFEKERIKVSVIPDHIIMEFELIGSENITLFGFYSSLLLYGSIFGCKSYSIINYSDYSRNNLLNKRIESFWNFVERVNV